MENLFSRREGRAYSEPSPPPGYVVIGTHRSGGGGHRWYGYGRVGSCSPHDLVEFFKANKSLFGGLASFEIKGGNLIIYALKPGGWIGKAGCWIKAISACLANGGRAIVDRLIYYEAYGKYLPKDLCMMSLIIKNNHHYKPFEIILNKFSLEAEKRIVGREEIYSQDGKHNYLFNPRFF